MQVWLNNQLKGVLHKDVQMFPRSVKHQDYAVFMMLDDEGERIGIKKVPVEIRNQSFDETSFGRLEAERLLRQLRDGRNMVRDRKDIALQARVISWLVLRCSDADQYEFIFDMPEFEPI